MIIVLSIMSCNAQTGIGSKDDPISGEFPESVKIFLGPEIVDLLLTSDRVDAYLLKEWIKDSTRIDFYQLKVIDKVERINDNQVDTLVSIIQDERNYKFDGVQKKCDFWPNLGFRFYRGQEEFSVLVSLNCDVIKFKSSAEEDRTEDCDLAHSKYEALGKDIFPNTFDQSSNSNPYREVKFVDFSTTSEQDINTVDTPGVLPTDSTSMELPNTPIDTTGTNNNQNDN